MKTEKINVQGNPLLHSRLPVAFIKIVLLATVYYCAARAGLFMAFPGTNVSPVWPPSGIGLAALLLMGRRFWPGIFLGALIANIAGFTEAGAMSLRSALAPSLAIAFGNTLEALLGAWLMRHMVRARALFLRPERAYQFAAAAAVAALVSALVGTTTLISAGIIAPAISSTIATTWWVGDLAGILVVTPFLLSWRGVRRLRTNVRLREGGLALAGLVILLWWLFDAPADASRRILVFALLPCIALCAYRYRTRGVTLALLLIDTAAVLATVVGKGPFAAAGRPEALFALEIFIGIFSMVGLVLAADAEGARKRARGRAADWLHWTVFLGAMVLTIVAWQYVTRATEQRAAEQFNREIADVQRLVGDRIAAYSQILHSARFALHGTDEIDAQDWHDYVGGIGLADKYPGIQSLGIALKATNKDALERRMRADGVAGFTVWPAGQRDVYVPVVRFEPSTALNALALGFDIMSEPVRRAALLRAMDFDTLALTGKVTLVQERGVARQNGFLMFLPVYRHGAAHSTTTERRQALEAYVFGAFRMDDLMAGIFGSTPPVAIEIFDGNSSAPASRLYASALSAQDAAHAAYRGTTSMAVGDAVWTLRLVSLPVFDAGIDRAKGLIVLFAGALIALLMFSITRALRVSSDDALALASQMTAALRRSERRFAVLVDSAGEFAIIATGLDGVIDVFSVGAERMLGYRADELIGLQTPALLHLPAEVALRAAELSAATGVPVDGFEVFVSQARTGAAETREWTYLCKDGSSVPVQLTVSAIRDGDGALTGFLGIARDITEQKMADKALRWAMLRADQASQAKSEFLANMSHELRTPLNAVLGMAQLLDHSALEQTQQRDVAAIRSAGVALLAIVNDILDFSKIEAGKLEIEQAPFRLDALAATLATMMSLNAQERPLMLTVALDPALPALVTGDSLRLQQVLINLAGNAIKFTEQGEVAVRFESAARSDGGLTLRVMVSDTGIGMSAGTIDKLFGAFEQADSSTTRRFGGTGLGLAISRRLVELMGGSISVESVPSHGSVFTLLLPLGVPAQQPAPSRVPPLRVVLWGTVGRAAAVLLDALDALGCEAAVADAGNITLPAGALADVVLIGTDVDGALLDHVRRARLAHSGIAMVKMLDSYERTHKLNDTASFGADAILDKPVTPVPLQACLLALAGGAVPRRAQPGRPLLACRVLLVEDNQLNQIVARRMLEAAGAQLAIAGDGQQAIDILRAAPDGFDLVLLDIQMPVMDGFETIAVIRGALGLRLPVLAMTAGVMEHERSRCIAAGMDGFIAKPIDFDQLIEAVSQHVPVARRSGPAQAERLVPAGAAAPGEGVFDLSQLDGLADDDGATVAGLLGILLSAGTSELDQLGQDWGEAARVAAARSLHTLRGTVGTFGARRFVAAARVLEQALQGAAGPALLDDLLAAVRVELVATLAAASAWRQRWQQTWQPGMAAVDAAQLAQLRQLLQGKNLAAGTLFAKIEAGLPHLIGAHTTQQVRAAIDRLDYSAALWLLDQSGQGGASAGAGSD
ncbi:CHASE domain-containing protein [Massilia sp. S19_KUP03_FR1]|uniref:CHASE domain-containing protein n=1 Tax=Massilia sp. S19_KUP03_FR1 TaxID=3025503 RepID=UPI002FCD7B2A